MCFKLQNRLLDEFSRKSGAYFENTPIWVKGVFENLSLCKNTFSISISASEKTSKLGKQEVSDMVVEASSTFSRNGSVRTSKRSVRSHSRQSSLAGDVSDGHISTSG